MLTIVYCACKWDIFLFFPIQQPPSVRSARSMSAETLTGMLGDRSASPTRQPTRQPTSSSLSAKEKDFLKVPVDEIVNQIMVCILLRKKNPPTMSYNRFF